jgi:hypothetical protein
MPALRGLLMPGQWKAYGSQEGLHQDAMHCTVEVGEEWRIRHQSAIDRETPPRGVRPYRRAGSHPRAMSAKRL